MISIRLCLTLFLVLGYSVNIKDVSARNIFDDILDAFSPEKAILGAVQQLCSFNIGADRSHVPNIDDLFFQLRGPCNYQNFPIRAADRIIESPLFDARKKVVLYIGGWRNTAESDNMVLMNKAYNCRGDYNYLALDASRLIDELYTRSAFNAEDVGRIVAYGLKKLNRVVPPRNIHLIGFSLGAHIVGAAGRHYHQLTGRRIGRITGLDPAKPCFSGAGNPPGLQRGDAEFVDVIHTNPGDFGKSEPLGDADFYVGGFSSVKPGCGDSRCSHGRAWQYYVESVYPRHAFDFMATRCNSLRQVADGYCRGKKLPMGLHAPHNTKGAYILNANSISPYGRNAYDRDNIIHSQCGYCR